jgi:Fe-S cluster assembly ATPase SufC
LDRPLSGRDFVSIQDVTDGISLMMHQQREIDMVMMRHGHQVSEYLNAQSQFLDRLGESIHGI